MIKNQEKCSTLTRSVDQILSPENLRERFLQTNVDQFFIQTAGGDLTEQAFFFGSGKEDEVGFDRNLDEFFAVPENAAEPNMLILDISDRYDPNHEYVQIENTADFGRYLEEEKGLDAEHRPPPFANCTYFKIRGQDRSGRERYLLAIPNRQVNLHIFLTGISQVKNEDILFFLRRAAEFSGLQEEAGGNPLPLFRLFSEIFREELEEWKENFDPSAAFLEKEFPREFFDQEDLCAMRKYSSFTAPYLTSMAVCSMFGEACRMSRIMEFQSVYLLWRMETSTK